MSMQACGSYYHVRRLEVEDRTSGGIVLPETARGTVWDAEVLAAGPGELLACGRRYPMQARPGDRVIFQRPDWLPLEGLEGFVADSRLVALIPGPAQEHVEPANDWVFLEPERVPERSEGGVIVAQHSLAGQDARSKRRGDELHAEFVALEQSEAWKLAPSEYDRHRICWDYLSALSSWELAALGEAIKRRGRNSQWKAYVPYLRPPQVRAGTVRCWGPGKVLRSGERGGMPLFGGVRVHLDREYRAVSVWDGARDLLAVPAGNIAAEEA